MKSVSFYPELLTHAVIEVDGNALASPTNFIDLPSVDNRFTIPEYEDGDGGVPSMENLPDATPDFDLTVQRPDSSTYSVTSEYWPGSKPPRPTKPEWHPED